MWCNVTMRKSRVTSGSLAVLLAVTIPALGQRDRQSESAFFEQLRSLFGRFQDADLRRAFRDARPIRCSELTSDGGEWRPVAFFNEDRKVGAWYHRSLAEVNGDLSVYTFKGECTKDQDSVQVVTTFPVKDSLDRYYDGRIPLKNVDMTVNPPVTAAYNSRSQSYRFELPYLYSVRGATYSLFASRKGDRHVTNVSNHWECKSVSGNDVTFQFLICETATLPRNLTLGNEGEQSFGTYAYFILSDGKEAKTSFKISFGAPGNEADEPEPAPATDRRALENTPLVDGWQIPAPTAKLAEVSKTEFRLRFSSETWAARITSPHVVSDQNVTATESAKTPIGADYCSWRPASATLATRVLGNEPDENVSYALTAGTGSITFDMKTHNGTRIGSLQCFFPGTDAAEVALNRLAAVVGRHLTLEIRP
jgi:hypothetical protein